VEPPRYCPLSASGAKTERPFTNVVVGPGRDPREVADDGAGVEDLTVVIRGSAFDQGPTEILRDLGLHLATPGGFRLEVRLLGFRDWERLCPVSVLVVVAGLRDDVAVVPEGLSGHRFLLHDV
jgi:hypothetical protein